MSASFLPSRKKWTENGKHTYISLQSGSPILCLAYSNTTIYILIPLKTLHFYTIIRNWFFSFLIGNTKFWTFFFKSLFIFILYFDWARRVSSRLYIFILSFCFFTSFCVPRLGFLYFVSRRFTITICFYTRVYENLQFFLFPNHIFIFFYIHTISWDIF